MEPQGTPTSMLVQGEAYPFKTTRCFLKPTKSVIIFKISSDIVFCSNLNVRPLCQTLSNALDVSKNTALTSRLSSTFYHMIIFQESYHHQQATILVGNFLIFTCHLSCELEPHSLFSIQQETSHFLSKTERLILEVCKQKNHIF